MKKQPVRIIIEQGETVTDEDEEGMIIDKDDVKLLIRALRQYKPTSEDEAQRYDILLEMLEMP